jgi:DNA-binding winged helix-turn-helix (wHTH) protein
MHTNPALPSAPQHDDVVVVRWPEQRVDAERLARLELPHLLLVEPGVAPPALQGCLVDWIRLPADDADMRARLTALASRTLIHPSVPVVDRFGELSFRGRRVFLSPMDQKIAELLVASFDRGVTDRALVERIWNGEGASTRVRVHVSRLRKRVRPLGLEITSIRGYGYRLHHSHSRQRDESFSAE